MKDKKRNIYFIMGVSGSGKTTVGELLARRLGLHFFDGDDYHDQASIEKMAGGIPLDDSDRSGWLQRLNDLAIAQREQGAVIACSALKSTYREVLQYDLKQQVVWVFLDAPYDMIFKRLEDRDSHFMPAQLLQSQFDTLEVPENALKIYAAEPPEKIVATILKSQLKK